MAHMVEQASALLVRCSRGAKVRAQGSIPTHGLPLS